MSRNFSFNDTFFEIRDFDWSRRARSRIWVNWVSFYGNAFRRKLTWSIVMNNFRLSLVVLRTHCSAKRVSNLLCRRTLGLTDFSAHLLWTSKEVEGFQALVSDCCCVSWERTFYLLLFCCASHIAQSTGMLLKVSCIRTMRMFQVPVPLTKEPELLLKSLVTPAKRDVLAAVTGNVMVVDGGCHTQLDGSVSFRQGAAIRAGRPSKSKPFRL